MYEDKMKFELNVNGKRRVVYAHPSMTLVEVLRQELNLTGTKQGCDDSNCGVCTVLLGRQGRKELHHAGGAGCGSFHHHDRRVGNRKGPASSAAVLYRPFCRAVRLLHTRHDHDRPSPFWTRTPMPRKMTSVRGFMAICAAAPATRALWKPSKPFATANTVTSSTGRRSDR